MTPLKAARQQYSEVVNLESQEWDQLVLENLPQVHYIAKRIHDRLPPHVPLEDLIHAGIVGLLEALRNFDSSRGVQVKTYAEIRIHGAILDSLRDFDWSPRAVRRKERQLEDSHNRLRQALGRSPSEQELAQDMHISLKELRGLLCDLRGLNLGSLQALEEGDGMGGRLYKYLPNSPDEDPYFLCLQSEVKDMLTKVVDELPQRERRLLALYYKEDLTMKEVGAVLGIGEGRVSQLHSTAMARLRARMKEMLGGRTGQSARMKTEKVPTPWKKP